MAKYKIDLTRTRQALEEYDKDRPRRDRIWDGTEDGDVVRALEEEKIAADKVREAFAKDTDNVNSRDHAFLVSPDDPWLRALVKGFS